LVFSAPTVVNVSVGSTQWSSAFIGYLQSAGLGAGGYSIPVGSSAQLQTLSWQNINQIRITFNENVIINASDLCLSGTNHPAYPFSSFQYIAASNTAVWTLASNLACDKLMIDLDATGLSPIRGVSDGNALLGAWTDGQSTYPSGYGGGAEDFKFSLNVLPGDVNGDNSVTSTDASLVQNLIGTAAGAPGYVARYDIDGTGILTTTEYNAIQTLIGSTLPSGYPAAKYFSPPTTSGIPNVSANENSGSQYIALPNYFQDDQIGSSALSYSITGDSNSSLFSSLIFDRYGGLTIHFAAGEWGNSRLTIRGTDSAYGGMFVETSFNVQVNAAPVISNFSLSEEAGNVWFIQGSVSDQDDNVQGMVVSFGGVLASYGLSATVSANGTFQLDVQLVGLQEGSATAQTTDSLGAQSNLAEYVIVFA